jgi:hypothetical protein
VVQVNFNFAPTRTAVLRQAVDQSSVILLSRVEVGVAKGVPITVAPPINGSRIFSAPAFQLPLLLMLA